MKMAWKHDGKGKKKKGRRGLKYIWWIIEEEKKEEV